MNAAADALNPPSRKKPRAARAKKRLADELPVRIGGMEYARTASTPARVLGFDQALIWACVALLAWVLVMVYSASIALPDNPRFGRYSPNYFVFRHAMWIGIAFVAALIAFQVRMDWWEKAAPWLFVVSLALLIAVLIPHVGSVVNGARRWIALGPMSFQPSEVAKITPSRSACWAAASRSPTLSFQPARVVKRSRGY